MAKHIFEICMQILNLDNILDLDGNRIKLDLKKTLNICFRIRKKIYPSEQLFRKFSIFFTV